MTFFFSLFILIGSQLATAAPTTSTNKVNAHFKKSFFQASVGYCIWHEDVSATSSGTPGDIPMQFHGFELGAGYLTPFKNFRFLQYYGIDFSMGAAKGAGKGPITDSLKDQPWMGLSLKPGFLYRATAVSEVGLFLPLSYRSVSWQLDDSAQLEMGDEAFSVGLGAMFVNRFTPFSSLLITVTHQHMWKSTVWGIAWQHDFK